MRSKNLSLLFSPYLFFFCLLASCSSSSSSLSTQWQTFYARDDGKNLERPVVYRAQVPMQWKRLSPPVETSIADTTLPICEFWIEAEDEQDKVRITLHTFPFQDSQTRIPPQAQIARWKQQLTDREEWTTQTQTVSHGGFHGLFFEGEGIMQGKLTKIMGWSMQLASIYLKSLIHSSSSLSQPLLADYTIKVIGSPNKVEQHRADLFAFVQSFECIEELPSPL